MSGRRVDSFADEIEELKRKIALLGTGAQALRVHRIRCMYTWISNCRWRQESLL